MKCCSGLQIGDFVWIAPPDGAMLKAEVVLSVEYVLAEGMFNPYTNQGAFRADYGHRFRPRWWKCL